jgi:photosystem II stability/assembly factor-like uncharacterized protein
MLERLLAILARRLLLPLGPCALALAAMPTWAQAPSAALKGVWEPVNYTEDLELTDVFFVTPEIGYVGGAAATILKTTDAGATWTAQLGGDPASTERPVQHLRFVSPTTGWATQNNGNLFGTRDGETWEQVGKMAEHYTDVVFTSETDGVYATGKDIYQTRDGGRTWSKGYTCAARAQVAGLARVLACDVIELHFISASVGFAVGHNDSPSVTSILRTDDGGGSWNPVSVIEGERGRDSGLFFVDENTGVLHLNSGKAYRTTDGGLTWTGLAATTLSRNVRFADPEIGWALNLCTPGGGCDKGLLSYTVDGGRRWASRPLALPARLRAFSLPRRDIAYVVGEHGMVYRYRVLPAGAPVAANAIQAIAMPSLANEVVEQLAELESGLEGLEAVVEAADSAEFAEAVAAGDAGAVEWFETNVPEFSEFEATIDTVAEGLPEIGRKHRNLNLLLQGLQLLGDLTGQGGGVKEAFVNLRQAKDLNSVSAALLGLRSQLDAAKTSVTAFESSVAP